MLYFKLDQNDRLWLLWSSCLRLHPKASKKACIPLNISQAFRCPSATHTQLQRIAQNDDLHVERVVSGGSVCRNSCPEKATCSKQAFSEGASGPGLPPKGPSGMRRAPAAGLPHGIALRAAFAGDVVMVEVAPSVPRVPESLPGCPNCGAKTTLAERSLGILGGDTI